VRARREDLTVRGFVPEEGDLRQQDAERGGDQQLEPAVPQEDEPGDRAAEPDRDRGADDSVEPRRAGQQAAVADDLRDVGVGAGDRREVRGAGVGLTDRSEP